MTSNTSPKHGIGFVLYASAVAALGGLLFGYDTAVIAGTVEFLQARFQLSDLALGWTVSSALLGSVAGAWPAGWMGDALGRKRSLLVCAVLFFVSAVWSGLASSAGELAAARILGGLGIGAASMLTPVYISEISPARMRGALTTLNQIAILIGMVVVYIVNAKLAAAGDEAWRVATAWRWMFGSGALPAVLFFLMLLGIPESPRWLVMRGLEDKARAILARLDPRRDPQAQLAEIHATASHKAGRFSDCLRPPVRRIFFIGAALAILQQITGINIVMYYAPRIFTSAGIETSSAIGHSVIIGLVMLGFTVVTLLLADRAGRRPLLLVSTACMTAGLFGLGAAYSGGGGAGGGSMLLWVLVYVAGFSIGMGPLVWTVIAEIFPNRVRAHAVSVTVLLLWLANFAVSQFFPFMLRTYEHKVFWFFGATCLVALAFIWKFIPETKGRSLEELEALLGEKPQTDR
jgi:sugar porter (SP) family MFS transporter